MITKLLSAIFCLLFTLKISAQNCRNLGQTPETAFPVCGTAVFHQGNVPSCSGGVMTVPGCSGNGNNMYEAANPYWYKFTCYQTGTLAFTIKPISPRDDYDWQLYDITNAPLSTIYTNSGAVVSANWAGTYAPTGASSSGVSYIQCGSDPADNKPTFAQMPTVVQGHTYLLMVSNFSNSQQGYDLSFGGGTAVITDPTEPHLKSAYAYCDGKELRIVTNKKMKCSSLAANGSDFMISYAGATPTAASSLQCTNGFDMDTIFVTLNNPLPPGTHYISMKQGSDGNSLLDNCDRQIPPADRVAVTVLPIQPTPLDSISPVKCRPTQLEVVFDRRIKCSSFSPSGNEFSITGPAPVTITGASAICNNDLTEKIVLTLQSPITTGGTYTLHLNIGSDGNTIDDECSQQTPPSDLNFTAYDTVNAAFTYTVDYACDKDVVHFNHNGAGGITSYAWNIDNMYPSTLQSPVATFTNFQPKFVTLAVTNGVCTDTARQRIVLDNFLRAAFITDSVICPNDLVQFKDTSVGNITGYQWIFGNGNTSTLQSPAAQQYNSNISSPYNAVVQLIVENNFGCFDTARQTVIVSHSCFITVPTAFTPNGDGLNDYLYPLVAFRARNLRFRVYNRYGQKLFESTNAAAKWDGRYKKVDQPPGTYVWQLSYTAENDEPVYQKGTAILIR